MSLFHFLSYFFSFFIFLYLFFICNYSPTLYFIYSSTVSLTKHDFLCLCFDLKNAIKCICKMKRWQNCEFLICKMKRWQNCEFLLTFLTKEGLNKHIKLFCKMKLRWITKRRSLREVFFHKVFLKIWQNLQESTFVGVSFLIKLQASGLKLYWKRETGVLLWILSIFLRTLSLKNTAGGCFCTKDLFLSIVCKEKSLEKNLFTTVWFNWFKY